MTAILFGSIGTLADTSELQRQAFNDAFAAHGLDWQWGRDEYLALLEKSGGSNRVTEYAAAQGQEVDADAVHETKSELFQKSLAETQLAARPGVVDTIQQARSKGVQVALVTTTTPENVSALLTALSPNVRVDDFDLVVDLTQVAASKPDKAAYDFAIDRLGVGVEDCLAIEDNLGGVEAAVSAGIQCVAFPNENTARHDFGAADGTVDRLSFSQLAAYVPSS